MARGCVHRAQRPAARSSALLLALAGLTAVVGQCPARDNTLGETEFTCPDGTRYIWLQYMQTTSWPIAQQEAMARGGFLPNQVENTNCINNIIGGIRYWVGIRDPDPPIANEPIRNFEYTAGPRDGIPVDQNDPRWCPGEPNNCCGGENCVVANWAAGSDCWNDWFCTEAACAAALVEFPTSGCFQEPSYQGSEGVNCVPDQAPEKAQPGATCEVGCPQAGYELVGSTQTLTCTVPAGQIEGSWTGTTPNCQPVECPVGGDASTVNDAAGATITFGNSVTYACGAGYGGPTSGDSTRQCQASGSLSGSSFVCSLCPENTFSAEGDNTCAACADGFISDPGSAECRPSCPLPFEHKWLETEWEPVLDVEDSGFLKYGRSQDIISIAFDNPDGYTFQSASIGSASETVMDHGDPVDDVSANAPSGPYTNPKQCYTRYEVYSVWGDVEPSCSSAINGNFLEYTCKLAVENKEPLDAIRSTHLERTVISNIPFIVRFPRQVSTSISGLSAFQPPDVLAAIVRQEVIVNVASLTDLVAQIKLYTSVQWPFRLTSPLSTGNPTDISANSFTLDTDCPDPDAGDVPNPAVDDANACGQVWLLDLDVANGALSAPCELDGDYSVQFSAECQASWPSDCPLVQDDQGEIQNIFAVNFIIDSEYFCPRVVDEVDVAASLSVYKDLGHTIAATNFILGQTAYFVAAVTSSKVTIVKAEVNVLSIQPDGDASVIVYNVADGSACDAGDAGDKGTVNGLVVQDGPCENGQPAEAWFNFLVDSTAVPNIAADGSRDFSVSVTLDVEFKNAGGMLMERSIKLLQRSNSQQAGAGASFGVNGSADDDVSGATATCAALAIGSAVVGALSA